MAAEALEQRGEPLKILFATAEIHPFSKVGGLADVVGGLTAALARRGHEVKVITPRHGSIKVAPQSKLAAMNLADPGGGHPQRAALYEAETSNGVKVYLVDSDRYFGRAAIYGEPDDLERYLFFSRAVSQAPLALQWEPDIIHCHDWHTAAVPLLAKELSAATVFTIHNLAHQGVFDDHFLARSGLTSLVGTAKDTPATVNNMMSLGILHADALSTVSPTYAREILTPEYGAGLDPLLRTRHESLFGIINGIDVEEFDPATDRFLAANYDAATAERKAINKAALQLQLGLPPEPNVPLVGMVTRLAGQKGFDILARGIEPFLNQGNAQFVLLGTGEERYEAQLRKLPLRYPTQVAVRLAFDAALAQLIYAGADMFLMPSRYEPCGLGQLIAMRYGAIPIVRRTGGLADTVVDPGPDLEKGNGFVFEAYTAKALLSTLERAALAYHNQEAWSQLVLRAMKEDFSWAASAAKYEEVYRWAVGSSKGRMAVL